MSFAVTIIYCFCNSVIDFFFIWKERNLPAKASAREQPRRQRQRDEHKTIGFKGWFSLAHKHNASENSSKVSINISTKHKNKHTCFSYVALTRNHRNVSISKHKKNKHVRSFCAYAYGYVAVIPSEDNIRKTIVFVLLMFMLMLMCW